MTTQRIPVHLKKDLAWTASDPDHEYVLFPKDAAILLRACNAHEGLVEAAEKVHAWLEAVIASGQYPIGAPTAVSHLSAALAAAEAK